MHTWKVSSIDAGMQFLTLIALIHTIYRTNVHLSDNARDGIFKFENSRKR